jgi:hypothetical protein
LRWGRAIRFILVVLTLLLPTVAYPTGEAGDTEWLEGATIEVRLELSAADTNSDSKVSGDLLIRNAGDMALTIQSPHNRLVLAFLVFDALGNLVIPKGLAKVDQALRTQVLSARSTYTHHFESLDFITGSGLFGYELSRGKIYKVLAVYQPVGPHGPGFTSQEITHEIPE